jgi:propionyl-CoA carboxylase beta chain
VVGSDRCGGAPGRCALPDGGGPQRVPTAVDAVAEYEDTLANPYIAVKRCYVDAVIPPSRTRASVIRSLRTLRSKRASSGDARPLGSWLRS